MFPEDRRNRIIQIMFKYKSINVKNLVKMFDVSDESIRRDLLYLQRKNMVRKTYGMVTLLNGIQSFYLPFVQERKSKEQKEKMAIAEEAVKLINSNKLILLDAGSTVEYIAEKIKYVNNHKNFSIITSALNIANECSKFDCRDLFVIGGRVLPGSLSMIGPEAVKEIQNYNIDIAFIGTTGVSIEHGFSSSSPHEVELKREMISKARIVVVVADHTKFGKYGLKSFCSFEEIDHLITSNLVEKSILKNIEEKYNKKLRIVKISQNQL
jgi:DeoR/GlpR family transcriptional regulator of sugar metabolism